MTKKIYLSTYSLKIIESSTECVLSQFDGKNDFFDFYKKFMDEIYTTVKKTHSFKDRTALHLTLDDRVKGDSINRTISGYLSSGVGGDKYKVRADGETDTAFESDPVRHITYRNLFFYIQIPRGSKYAFLIIQKRRDLGAKGLLEKALNGYLNELSYNNFKAQISNFMNGRVYDKMMKEGNLKNIDFIKRRIPANLEEYYSSGEKTEKGTLTTSIRAPFSLGPYWKDFIDKLYKRNNKSSTIELNDGADNYDEIEFELEINNKVKTFHMVARNRTQPDVEVSSELDFQDNEPTEESLIHVSKNLIEDLLVLKPNV